MKKANPDDGRIKWIVTERGAPSMRRRKASLIGTEPRPGPPLRWESADGRFAMEVMPGMDDVAYVYAVDRGRDVDEAFRLHGRGKDSGVREAKAWCEALLARYPTKANPDDEDDEYVGGIY